MVLSFTVWFRSIPDFFRKLRWPVVSCLFAARVDESVDESNNCFLCALSACCITLDVYVLPRAPS